MKNRITIVLVFFAALAIISCKKPGEAPGGGTESIVGRWHVVSDSNWFVSAGLLKSTSQMYISTPGDYYNFEANGGLSVAEGTYDDDTLLYKLAADTLKISYTFTHPNFSEQQLNTFILTTLTQHQLVLTSIFGGNLNPDGYVNEIMVFSR